MNTCKTCKWWTRYDPPKHEWETVNILYGDCGSPRLVYGYADSRRIAYSPKGLDEYIDAAFELPVEGNTDMLLYMDYSSYAATMQTGQDFGCIHWAAPALKE